MLRRPARRRGKRISRRCVADGRGVRASHRPRGSPRLPMRFRAARRVASLAWVASGDAVSPARTDRSWPLSAHGNVTARRFPRRASPAACRRRSRSPFFASATRIPRLPMRFLAAPCVASLASDRYPGAAEEACWREPSRAMRRTPWLETASLAGGRLRAGRRGSHCARRSQGDRCAFPHRRAGSQKQASFAANRCFDGDRAKCEAEPLPRRRAGDQFSKSTRRLNLIVRLRSGRISVESASPCVSL